MKIIVGDKVYLQKFAMVYMEEEFYAVPGILHVSFIQNYPIHFIDSEQDAAKFDYVFDDEQAVAYLKSCDYIFDFIEYSKKSVKELQQEMLQTIEDFDNLASRFEDASKAYQSEHNEEMHRRFDEARLKCEQLRFMIAFKTGELKFPSLPEGVEVNLKVENGSIFSRFFSRFKKAPH